MHAWIERFQRLPPELPDGALALVLLVSAGAAAYQDGGSLSPAQAALIAMITLPVALRRHYPTIVSAVVGAALILNVSLGFSNSFVENFAVLLALYTMYASAPAGWRLAAMSALVVVGVFAGVTLSWHNQHRIYLYDIGYNAIIFALPVILGYGVRTRRSYLAQMHAQSELLAREAAANERTAIARELHDVIAHSVSVMVLQAGAGARLAQRDPQAAAPTFEVIEHTGRAALSDLRRVVGVLKSDGVEAAALAPQPSLLEIDGLIERIRQAGIRVEVRIEGMQRALPPGVEVSAYRIVQESLTNILKHADADEATVAITYAAGDVVVEVTDNGRNGSTPSSGGTGLVGMQERIALLGGQFQAARTASGFRVWACLPLDAPPV